MPSEVILHNSAQCKDCGDVIESLHRHDYVQCKCGSIFVDGGREYLRRGWKTGAGLIEKSLVLPKGFEDTSPEATLTLLEDFKRYNEAFLKSERDPNSSYDRSSTANRARLAMYDRMFNQYGWVERIEKTCEDLIQTQLEGIKE